MKIKQVGKLEEVSLRAVWRRGQASLWYFPQSHEQRLWLPLAEDTKSKGLEWASLGCSLSSFALILLRICTMKHWRGTKIDPVLRGLLLSFGLLCYELKCWVQRLQTQSSLWALAGTPSHSCVHQTSHPYCTPPGELSRNVWAQHLALLVWKMSWHPHPPWMHPTSILVA